MNFRSSRPEVFCEKGVLGSSAKFTGKHLCKSLSFNKVAGLRPATLLKRRLWHRCFPVNFVKFLRTPILTEHLWWLLLKLQTSFFCKKSSSGAYLNFNNNLPNTYKKVLIDTLLYRTCNICFNYSSFHQEIDYLKTVW